VRKQSKLARKLQKLWNKKGIANPFEIAQWDDDGTDIFCYREPFPQEQIECT